MQPADATLDDLNPVGSFFHVDQGPLQARVYHDTGHIQLAGPDLAGAMHATTVTLGPPTAKIKGITQTLGHVVSARNISDGFKLVRELKGSAFTVASRLSFPSEAILRYEVTDWRGQTPTETRVTGA
jgi:alpha-D-xyloside xylohydrolase